MINDRADYYRHRANELRRRAEEVSFRLHGEWLKLAEKYDALAESLEGRGAKVVPFAECRTAGRGDRRRRRAARRRGLLNAMRSVSPGSGGWPSC